MYCTSCGAQVEEGARFCTGCGVALGEGSDTKVMPAVVPGGAAATTPSPVAATAAAQPAPAPVAYAQPTAAPVAAAATPAAKSNRGLIVALGIAAAALLAAVAAFLLVNSGAIGGPSSYQVSYETGGGSIVSASQVDVGGSLTSPANPVKDGYTFEGWYTDAACTQRVTFPYAPEGDSVLYAKWEEAPEEADAKGGEQGGNTTIVVTPGTTTNTTTTQPSTASNSTVSISIVGADGSTRTASVRRQGTTERIFPDSNTRRLSNSEVSALSDAERCIAWNEIIAASNGYMFKNSGLAAYFNSCSWYRPVSGASGGGSLSAEASANIDLLKSYTDSWWQNLATY